MMEPIYFYFKETPLNTNNKFTLDFSNTGLVYQIKFSLKNDYYVTTMNFNFNTRYNRSIRKKLIIAKKRPCLSI